MCELMLSCDRNINVFTKPKRRRCQINYIFEHSISQISSFLRVHIDVVIDDVSNFILLFIFVFFSAVFKGLPEIFVLTYL